MELPKVGDRLGKLFGPGASLVISGGRVGAARFRCCAK
jgi:hypothetical protein